MNLTLHTIELDVSIFNYQVELLLIWFNQRKTNYYKTLGDLLFA